MEKEKLSELRKRFIAFLKSEGYTDHTLGAYTQTLNNLERYMASNSLDYYDKSVGKDFLKMIHGGRTRPNLSNFERKRVYVIREMTEFLKKGTIEHVFSLKGYAFDGTQGIPFRLYIDYCRKVCKLSSLKTKQPHLFLLYSFITKEGLTMYKFNSYDAVRFIKSLDGKTNLNNIIKNIRVFMVYLCREGLIEDKNETKWRIVFAYKDVRNSKLQTTYTVDEINAVLSVIDHTNPRGKRDYAMFLLAVRYGMRESDIIGLRFSNIDWEQNKIRIVQQKTGKTVTFPLTEEVGNAIIEYIRYARPKYDNPFVFLTVVAPYKELGTSGMSDSILRWMRDAGVNCIGKKHGLHAFRHSLATNLLNAKQSLPIVSEILGHSYTRTTLTYIRVSIDMLKQCSLDVPLVPSTFYENLYG